MKVIDLSLNPLELTKEDVQEGALVMKEEIRALKDALISVLTVIRKVIGE